ncbi:MAG: hypothetical protein JNL82_24730 [Myxococcales bacterium]|nr:hypothetical protein [Myxococcales bacterium]
MPPRCARSLLALALAACQGTPAVDPTRTAAAKTDIAKSDITSSDVTRSDITKSDITSSDVTKSDVTRTDPPSGPPPELDAPADDVSYTPGPLAATAVDGGVLVVWSRHDAAAGKSEVLALLLDEQGRVAGSPRLVRRTSGQILDLAVHRRDGAAWLAWFSLLADAPRARGLVAAMSLAADLSSVRPPITLGQFSDESILAWPERDLLRVLDLAGGAAAVAAAGPSAECIDIVTDRPSKCPAFNLFWAHEDGTFVKAAHQGADGGDPGINSFIDIGTGVILDTFAWHGGATFSTLHAAYEQPASDLPLALPDCRPPFARGFTGDAIVTLCPDDYAADDEKCTHNGAPVEEGTCPHVHAVGPGGKPVSPAGKTPDRLVALVTQKTRCVDGRPVVEVAWRGGPPLRLDPLAPGASLDLVAELGLWTGRHAVKISGDGARERWTCTKAAFTLAEALTDEFPLDPPARDLKAVPHAP